MRPGGCGTCDVASGRSSADRPRRRGRPPRRAASSAGAAGGSGSRRSSAASISGAQRLGS
ncbi:hypothetical protein MMSR116_18055 [Methylobacterium mesophilicum SR1.6/6]|uniref:Uncharacterized protein n=1 Tax=Methylobacterium mesophilicum SR1.6/6 TaxID=908290 RepID=A0A6B9FNY4_9HYPH|nr:hypothetical protein MMSR116_18055 [Methylobacterium mesophilicum SR1.6/6]